MPNQGISEARTRMEPEATQPCFTVKLSKITWCIARPKLHIDNWSKSWNIWLHHLILAQESCAYIFILEQCWICLHEDGACVLTLSVSVVFRPVQLLKLWNFLHGSFRYKYGNEQCLKTRDSEGCGMVCNPSCVKLGSLGPTYNGAVACRDQNDMFCCGKSSCYAHLTPKQCNWFKNAQPLWK